MTISEQQKAFICGTIDGWYEKWKGEIIGQDSFAEALDDLRDKLCNFILNEHQLYWIECIINSLYFVYKDRLEEALAKLDKLKRVLKTALMGLFEIVGIMEAL